MDLTRAKTFYRDTLGLQLKGEDRHALVFGANGTTLRVAAVALGGSGQTPGSV